jgi:hypothetical protein
MHATESSGWLSIHLLLRYTRPYRYRDRKPWIVGATDCAADARLTVSQRDPPFEMETNQEIVMLSKTALRSRERR